MRWPKSKRERSKNAHLLPWEVCPSLTHTLTHTHTPLSHTQASFGEKPIKRALWAHKEHIVDIHKQ